MSASCGYDVSATFRKGQPTGRTQPRDKDRALSTLALTQQLLTLIHAMEHLAKTFTPSPPSGGLPVGQEPIAEH